MTYFQNDYYDFSEMKNSGWIFTAEECRSWIFTAEECKPMDSIIHWRLRAYSLCMREILMVDTYDELIVWADLHNITIDKTIKHSNH